jgi:hypothetical protein
MQNQRNTRTTKNVKRLKLGQPKNPHVAAISRIYEGYKLLGELERSKYDDARRQILAGLMSATKAMQLGQRLAS